MLVTVRHRIGMGLMGVAVLAAIIVQLATGAFVEPQTVHEGATPLGSEYFVASEVALRFNAKYAIPLLIGFSAGLVCFAWPSRKPPRILS
jgi:hypothetical protein